MSMYLIPKSQSLCSAPFTCSVLCEHFRLLLHCAILHHYFPHVCCCCCCSQIGAPLLLVNAEDPEMVTRVSRIAANYRIQFQSDVVVELVGYRRHGHNEVDEPAFTQVCVLSLLAHFPVSTA